MVEIESLSELQCANGLADWLKGTVSSHEGHPRSFFRSTPVDFGSFAPFQHFGPLTAAQARASARRDVEHRYIEVWLRIRNPLPIIDDESANQVSRMARNAMETGHIDRVTLDRILDDITATQGNWHRAGEDYSARKWRCSMEVFAKELSSLDYDGIVYQNAVEGGGLSYVPFRSSQIWWIDRPAPEA